MGRGLGVENLVSGKILFPSVKQGVLSTREVVHDKEISEHEFLLRFIMLQKYIYIF